MTDPTGRAVAAITRTLTQARNDGADMNWTAHAILTSLRGLGWRPTEARPAPDWHTATGPPAEPTAEYRAERARILGEART